MYEHLTLHFTVLHSDYLQLDSAHERRSPLISSRRMAFLCMINSTSRELKREGHYGLKVGSSSAAEYSLKFFPFSLLASTFLCSKHHCTVLYLSLWHNQPFGLCGMKLSYALICLLKFYGIMMIFVQCFRSS